MYLVDSVKRRYPYDIRTGGTSKAACFKRYITATMTAPSNSNKEELCQRICRSYQARFPDIPALSSQAFISSCIQHGAFSKPNQPFLLVDVRTMSERQTSMLEGAVTLQEFKRQYMAKQLSPDVQIITYCTVGYRSGLEARRLKYQCGLEGRIHSLDGIVAYTHAMSGIEQQETSNRQENSREREKHQETAEDSSASKTTNPGEPSTASSARVPRIINPGTNMVTRNVHTFGAIWDNLCDGFHGVHFSFPVLMIQLLRVGYLVVVCSIQEFFYRARGYCC